MLIPGFLLVFVDNHGSFVSHGCSNAALRFATDTLRTLVNLTPGNSVGNWTLPRTRYRERFFFFFFLSHLCTSLPVSFWVTLVKC